MRNQNDRPLAAFGFWAVLGAVALWIISGAINGWVTEQIAEITGIPAPSRTTVAYIVIPFVCSVLFLWAMLWLNGKSILPFFNAILDLRRGNKLAPIHHIEVGILALVFGFLMLAIGVWRHVEQSQDSSPKPAASSNVDSKIPSTATALDSLRVVGSLPQVSSVQPEGNLQISSEAQVKNDLLIRKAKLENANKEFGEKQGEFISLGETYLATIVQKYNQENWADTNPKEMRSMGLSLRIPQFEAIYLQRLEEVKKIYEDVYNKKIDLKKPDMEGFLLNKKVDGDQRCDTEEGREVYRRQYFRHSRITENIQELGQRISADLGRVQREIISFSLPK